LEHTLIKLYILSVPWNFEWFWRRKNCASWEKQDQMSLKALCKFKWIKTTVIIIYSKWQFIQRSKFQIEKNSAFSAVCWAAMWVRNVTKKIGPYGKLLSFQPLMSKCAKKNSITSGYFWYIGYFSSSTYDAYVKIVTFLRVSLAVLWLNKTHT
jgi:hypothetical protein